MGKRTKIKSKANKNTKTLVSKECQDQNVGKAVKKNNSINITSKSVRKRQKRQKYSRDAVERAVKAYANGVPLRTVADTFGVPSTTIFRKSKNPQLLDCKMGPATVLSQTEEDEIVKWILYRAQTGSPITKTELLDSVQLYMISLNKMTPFTENRPGRHWYEGFCNRHPHLRIRTAQNLTLVRASVTEEDLRSWFDEVGAYLRNKNLINIDSSRVFNCDETNIQLCPKPEKVLVQKGARSVYKVVDAHEKESVTALFMYSASGVRAPPMVIYTYKEQVPKKIIDNFPIGWGIGLSDSGWMTTETFYEYFTNVFYKWLLKENTQFPVIVYMDGHSSHCTLPLVKFCRERNIELISLYPHATHLMQPLDVGLFHPFKEVWKKTVPKWKIENNVMRLKKEQFPAVLQIALNSLKNESEIVINAFKACGLVPFNADAVEYDVLNKGKKTTIQNQTQKSEQQQSSVTTNEDNQFLETFEKTIDSKLLQEFKNAEINHLWTGSIEQKGLFEYWLSIKKRNHDETVKHVQENVTVKPIIKSVDALNNHKVIVISQSDDQQDSIIEAEGTPIPISNDQIIELPIIWANSPQESITKNTNIYVIEDISNSDINFDTISSDSFDINSTLHSTANSSNEQVCLEAESEKADTIPAETIQSEIDLLTNVAENYITNDVVSEIEVNKENNKTFLNKNTKLSDVTTFDSVFTLPEIYLPEKKRSKLKGSKKTKLPSAGTSDDWMKIQMEKENEKRLKEEKKEKKKMLQEEKKKLAEEKKKLDAKMREIQNKIKIEQI